MTDSNLDRVRIVGVYLDCVIGINDWERLTKQRIRLDLTLHADLSRAGKSDRIEETVNYRTITHRIVEEISGSSFGLIEALAENVAALCLEDERVQAVEVSVRKPGALRHAEWVGVEITRRR